MAQTDSVSSDRIDERTQVLKLDGRCDLSTTVETEQKILADLDAGRTEIIFDLRGVISFGSAVLRVRLRGLIRTKGRSGRLVLIRPNAYACASLARSRMYHAFPTFIDLRTTLASANAAP